MARKKKLLLIITCVAVLVAGWWLLKSTVPALQAIDWQLAFELKGHTQDVRTAELSQDGARLVTGAAETIVWDLRTRNKICRIDKASRRVSFSPDGRLLVLATELSRSEIQGEKGAAADTIVSIHDANNGDEIVVLPKFDSRVCLPAFSPDSKAFAVAPEKGPVRVWNVTSGKPMRSFQPPTKAYATVYPVGPRSVVFSKDEKYIGIAYLKKINVSQMDDYHKNPWLVTAWRVDDGIDVTGKLPEPMKKGLAPRFFNHDLWGTTANGVALPTTAVNDLEEVEFKGLWCIMAFSSPDGSLGVTTHSDGTVRVWKK